MKDKTIVTCTGILALAGLETAALCTGNDGIYLMPVVSAISGLVGAALAAGSPKLQKIFQ